MDEALITSGEMATEKGMARMSIYESRAHSGAAMSRPGTGTTIGLM